MIYGGRRANHLVQARAAELEMGRLWLEASTICPSCGSSDAVIPDPDNAGTWNWPLLEYQYSCCHSYLCWACKARWSLSN